MAGVQETKDVLVAVNEVGLVLVKQLKDGVQLGDFQAFFEKLVSDPDFKAKLAAAYDGALQVPAELTDLDLSEGLALAVTQVSYVPKYVEALKS